MAVSAYASLVSLTHVLDNVHYRAQHRRLHVDIQQIGTLKDKVSFLLDFVEANYKLEAENIRDFWRQISEVAFDAEETFDSHVINQLMCQSQGEQSGSDMISTFCDDVDRLIQKIDFIKEELCVLTVEGVDALVQKLFISIEPSSVSLAAALDGQNTLVGFDEHVVKVMERFTSDESKLQIIPIVGMGGIGKTTLTRHVYDKSYIVDHFDKRIWLTISQDYSVQNLLQGLLGVRKESGTSLAELGTKLYKTLYGRRYLIVMDDVWTIEPFHDLKRYFPDNGNGSRIIMTTRHLAVPTCLGCRDPYLINFLNKDQSWNLLCRKIFSQDWCPHPELEDIGKDIAKSCRGLPLAIIVIGSQLARSNMTREYWKLFLENIYSFGNLEGHDHCLKILSLSYNSLSLHLKPCFLYFRVFREDSEIVALNLIRSWVAEGFIKQMGDKSQEDLAEEYIKELIDRNLVFVRKRSIGGKVYSCGIHDLFRELCIRESDNEGFLSTPRIQHLRGNSELHSCSFCGESITNKEATSIFEIVTIPSSTSEVSTDICDACRTRYSHIKSIKFVSVMGYVGSDINNLFVHPTCVRFVSLAYYYGNGYLKLVYASMLCVLWNLQSLIISDYRRDLIVLSPEIWDMPQLRHLEVTHGVLPHPVVGYVEGNDMMIMKSLQSLVVNVVSITEKILPRIQNLKRIELYCPYSLGRECPDCSLTNNDSFLTNLVRLHKLHGLVVKICRVENIIFPHSLMELRLSNLDNPSETMTIIGLLPNLEMLELYSIKSWLEWTPVEGQFLKLKGLMITECSLERWEADYTHFPNLEWLHLTKCKDLHGIPLAIGDIATLHFIYVYKCSEFADDWARQLWEEQQSCGNENLQIEVDGRGGQHIFRGNGERFFHWD